MKFTWARGVLVLVVLLGLVQGRTVAGDSLNACCYRDPTGAPACQNVQTPSQCIDNLNGQFVPSILCADINASDCTIRQGACCRQRECAIVRPSQCIQGGGSYLGDGTACGPEVCLEPPQACCFATACRDIPPQECAADGGLPVGPGTSCATSLCAPDSGACCTISGCHYVPAGLCEQQHGTFHGIDTTCRDPFECIGRCCLHDGQCADTTIDRCFNELLGIFFIERFQCDPTDPCPPTGACCGPFGDCRETSRDLCEQFYEGDYGGDGTDCPDGCVVEACCREGQCIETPATECILNGGTRLGLGSQCAGDKNGNGADDSCEEDKPCAECGPGDHWVDSCLSGTDSMPSGALVGIDLDLDCFADISMVLSGPVHVWRSHPRDDSNFYPGTRLDDGHDDVMDTEMLSLNLSGGGITLKAGLGNGNAFLPPTRGVIAELPSDPSRADSFFDVFFEINYAAGQYAYNHEPLRVESELTCIPPDSTYIHPTGCLPLYTDPKGGEHIANLVSARHFTYPGCCLAGRCAELPPAICEQEGGRVVPSCLGDGNGNKIDDACEPRECAPNEGGDGCQAGLCESTIEECRARCARFRPDTGEVRVEACDCTRENECHVEIERPSVAGGIGDPCIVPDDGSGTAVLPPPGCPYLSPDQVHMIIDGLPAGTTIQLGAIHQQFICNKNSSGCSFVDVDCSQFGGSLGGEQECADSSLTLHMQGTGSLNTFNRMLNLPVSFETHIAPRTRGDMVQSFDTEMSWLFGQIIGDPDFDLLRITAGINFGLPSPGHTTLTQLPGGMWQVDSFFDITYRIDFVGAPGGSLAGMSGSTTGTIRMQTGAALRCRGLCAEDHVCREHRTVNPDGSVTLCCDCVSRIEACCLPDQGCIETLPERCREAGGIPLGPDTRCGENTCKRDEPCSECGPGPHWVDQCPGGHDFMPSGALVGIDTTFDCLADTSMVLQGPVVVARSSSRDDSMQFPGLRPNDGHLDVIDTQMLSLHLSGPGGVQLVAGAGMASAPIRPTNGAIMENPSNSSLADSFFDVFFELDMGGGQRVYNQMPLQVRANDLTCLPPIASYIHPVGCFPLFTSPIPGDGQHVANLVTARHDTFPCGAKMESSIPAHRHTLWRTQKNIVRIRFDSDISLPNPPQCPIMIQEMLPGPPVHNFGPDLAAGFMCSVENNRVLKIQEVGATLQHRKWYSFRNPGNWPGVCPFNLQLLVQMGDVSDNGITTAADAGLVYSQVPCLSNCGDARREDVNGDLRITTIDAGQVYGKVPSFTVPVPSGHEMP